MAPARCLSIPVATRFTTAMIWRRRKTLIARENELRGLIERAGESTGGAVIGSFAYRSDYDAVLAEEKLVQRNAAEKNCSFASPLQSDQTIR